MFPKELSGILGLGNGETKAKQKENKLYTEIQTALERYWRQEYPGIDKFVSQITANQGSRKTGGLWSRPDIVFATCSKFEFIPGYQNFDLATVEVKLASSVNETAIVETVSHRSKALKSYLLIYRDDDGKNSKMVESIAEMARKNKIGLFTIGDDGLNGGIENLDNWSEIVSPIKNDSVSPVELNEFIKVQCSEVVGRETSKW